MPSGTDLAEARSAYRARARLLHPDTAHESIRTHAQQAMSDLNRAWELVQGHIERGTQEEVHQDSPQRSSGYADRGASREPGVGECQVCGWTPAGPLTTRQVTGRLIFWSRGTLSLWLCRDCGLASFRQAQLHNLKFGWWGAFACFFNVAILVTNLVQIRRHRPMGQVQRASNVVASSPSPVPSRPLRRTPAAYFGTAIGSVILVAVTSVFVQNSAESPSEPQTPQRAIGTCLTEWGEDAPCSDQFALFEIRSETDDPENCKGNGEVFEDAANSKYYCTVALE